MTSAQIQSALADITAETDPTLKHLKMASLVSAIFRQRGIELVVVDGSAIEFYTEGANVSGDLDMCLITPSRVDIRTRQELMGLLGAKGGPRNWQVAGQFVDVLGEVEHPRTHPIRGTACSLWSGEARLPGGTARGARPDFCLSTAARTCGRLRPQIDCRRPSRTCGTRLAGSPAACCPA
jgi:hypothetical protein